MVLHTVVLETIGAYLVPALSRPHLLAPILGLLLIVVTLHMFLHPASQGGTGFCEAVVAAATLGCGLDARGPMPDATAILMLVAMLPARTGTRIPFDV
jgi:hypothetical protein